MTGNDRRLLLALALAALSASCAPPDGSPAPCYWDTIDYVEVCVGVRP